jgi:hypothetical protein
MLGADACETDPEADLVGPAAAMSSPNIFILAKYSMTLRSPFLAVDNAMRVFTVRSRTCDPNIYSITCQASAAVSLMATLVSTSLDSDDRRKPRTCPEPPILHMPG